MDGASRIAAERVRQVDGEGWSSDHDDGHDGGELAMAAAAYVLYTVGLYHPGEYDRLWPWSPEWFKPTDNKVRALEKAGALIAAEIDRLTRRGEE